MELLRFNFSISFGKKGLILTYTLNGSIILLGLSEEYLLNKPGFKETLFLYEPTLIHINKSLKINSQDKIKNQIENYMKIIII